MEDARGKKQRNGYLAASTIQRYIGLIPETTPGYREMLGALRSKATDQQTKVMRKVAVTWCNAHKVQRQYLRLRRKAEREGWPKA